MTEWVAMSSPANAGVPDQAFTQAAVTEAPCGVAFVGTDLRLSWVNEAFASLSGLPIDAHAGRRLSEVLPALRPAAEDQVREVLQNGTPLFDVPLGPATPSAGASARHGRATITPVHSSAGTLLGACFLCVDVTDTVRLTEQLLQSQKLESVGLLANVIAHDFNNLLAVVHGYCDLMLRDATDVARRTARLGEIRAAAVAAGQLSKQLLVLSRRNTGVVGPIDVNLLVRGIGRMLDRILPANVAHDMVLAENLGLTLADPGEVEQVVMNLITNAIDAMPAGGLLTIETANATVSSDDAAVDSLAAGDYVTLRITDTGVGMDAATKARIFEPLFSTKPAGRATGLGLAAVQAVAERRHGAVRVVSEPAKGSTFTLYLPSARTLPTATSPAPAVQPPGARPPTILLVEDHVSLRRALVAVLEESGYAVIEAGAGGEAVRVVAEHQGPIDLLLSDIELPDANGLELAERLRAARPGLCVLIASGFGEQALDAKRRGYATLGKPFAMGDLVDAIQSTLYPAISAAPTVLGTPIAAGPVH